MNIYKKIISGSEFRKSRLHDEKGNLVPLRNIFFNGPRAAITGFLRICFGVRPELPWVSYTAIEHFKKFLTKESKILEFGSGMSTIWFSKYAGHVYAVEDYKPWYDRVKFILESKEIDNVSYLYVDTEYDYVNAFPDEKFDLIVVDGKCRSECMRVALTRLNTPGLIYLDNSDRLISPAGPDMRQAEHLLTEFGLNEGAIIEKYTDFAPTQLFVQEGMLLRK